MKLQIRYHQESDTLWLGNGRPTPNGEDVAERVIAFFDDDDQPNAVMIENAAEILLPILQASVKAGGKPVVEEPAKAEKAAS